MNVKLGVKELSDITNVSKRNIRYYDSIGLFEPTGTSENGYKYYGIEKIEELRLVSYLRHAGVSLKDIEKHLKTRNIDEYVDILTNQLDHINNELTKINALKTRLENKLNSIKSIRSIEQFDQILIKSFPKRNILRLRENLKTLFDWEKAMLEIEEALPPSLTVGDNGFIVDLDKYNTRTSEEFSGIYVIADDPFMSTSKYLDCLEAGDYLTIYLNGNHEDARLRYFELIKYAKKNQLKLDHQGYERTLIDNFLSSDKALYITEIQIRIIEKRQHERLDTR